MDSDETMVSIDEARSVPFPKHDHSCPSSSDLCPAEIPKGGAGDFGTVSGAFFECLRGVPVTAVLGDQHAASFGQCCFREGDTKATFGTGCFVMRN